jgi:fumarylacetoacetase
LVITTTNALRLEVSEWVYGSENHGRQQSVCSNQESNPNTKHQNTTTPIVTMIPIVPVPADSDFSLYNLPFGVFSTQTTEDCHGRRRCATRLGDTVIDLTALEAAGLFDDILLVDHNGYYVFAGATHLNRFLELPKSKWLAVRQRLQELFNADHAHSLVNEKKHPHGPKLLATACFDIRTVQLHLPIMIGDYTDFYSSRYHAENVGQIFRGHRDLQPNWKCLPVAYHGRASTVVVSGHEVVRPSGQRMESSSSNNNNINEENGPVHGPTQQLDFEVELATILGGFARQNHDDDASSSTSTSRHPPLTIESAANHIFGFLLLNDWSARDLQRWEYVPLGPFTAKNFCTTVSPWLVMAEALTTVAAVDLQDRSTILDYLRQDDNDRKMYDIDLTASITTSSTQSYETVVSRTNAKYLYWSAVQQLVHHSVSGCQMRSGDVLGSGTISTPTCGGSLLELTHNGTTPISIVGTGGSDESRRSFLENGDTVILRGVSGHGSARVGFGECRGTVVAGTTRSTTTTTITTTTMSEQPSLMTTTTTTTTTTTSAYQDFTLYGYWQSSATWRVRIALAAKKIPYTIVPIDLSRSEHKSNEFKSKNPLGQVPLLECTNTWSGIRVYIAQSLSIIQFLEDAFPNNVPLWPRDPFEKAFANQIVEMINAGTQPLQNSSFLAMLEEKSEGKVRASTIGRFANENGLAAVETLIAVKNRPGPFAVGSFQPSIVDIFLIPQMYNAKERYGIDTSVAFPTLESIVRACTDHPWFKQAHPAVQPDAPENVA